MDLREAVERASKANILEECVSAGEVGKCVCVVEWEAIRTLIEHAEQERPATLQFLRFVAEETLLRCADKEYAAVAAEVLKSVANQIEQGRHLKGYIPDQRKETGDV